MKEKEDPSTKRWRIAQARDAAYNSIECCARCICVISSSNIDHIVFTKAYADRQIKDGCSNQMYWKLFGSSKVLVVLHCK